MLTLKQLRDDKEAAVRRLAKKGVDARPVIDRIEQLDDRRKAIQQELDNCLSQQNQAAKMIGALMGQGKRDEAEAKKAEVAALKEKSVKLSAEMKQTADVQASRGVRVTGGPLGGVRMLGSVAIPLFTGVFRHAETLSAAMEARCYHGEQGRTRLHALVFGRGDALAAVVTALLLICVIVINLQLV